MAAEAVQFESARSERLPAPSRHLLIPCFPPGCIYRYALNVLNSAALRCLIGVKYGPGTCGLEGFLNSVPVFEVIPVRPVFHGDLFRAFKVSVSVFETGVQLKVT